MRKRVIQILEETHMHELVDLLVRLGQKERDGAFRAQGLQLLKLYSMFLEECGHHAFVDHWNSQLFSLTLRVYVDRLQDALQEDHCFAVLDICKKCIRTYAGNAVNRCFCCGCP